ncbi:hypothetical protein DFP72DRAFT_1077468 [Ephemerocybe angulata]|uniref:Uncharacterized protein n=1 Tax=Ephemerocybe angulata TaxID=980116 RepID=A0A8H6LVJ5_9AGAR|nr:hypothetical protein DFP72DRAFT_1077468 [Tulosesus angulatus]
MAATIEDVKKLARMKFSSQQVTLRELLLGLEKGTEVFSLKRSQQFPSNFIVWNNSQDDYVVCSHAFVIKYASSLDTGNFCPDNAKPPEWLREQMRRREPGLTCQVSLTFDARVDSDLHNHLSIIEEWGKGPAGFPTEGKSRNPWNSPASVSAGQRFAVASNIFQKRTGYNVKDDRYEVPYDVHPWVSQATVPHNPSWIPNPNLVRVMHKRRNDMLEPIEKSSNPKLDAGDVVSMTFKIVFSATGLFWNMSFTPIQVIRMGQIKNSEIEASGHAEDHAKLFLPKAGDRLRAFISDNDQSPAGRGISPTSQLTPLSDLENDENGSADDNASESDIGSGSANGSGRRSNTPSSDDGDLTHTEEETDRTESTELSEEENQIRFKTEVVTEGEVQMEGMNSSQRGHVRGTKRAAVNKNTRSVKAKTVE